MKVVSAITGKASKRIGNAVFSNVFGTTIAREYNPNVNNPNTDAQVNTRSRFKLLSQLAALMAPSIAIRRDGLKSPRNQFVSVNYGNTAYEEDQATVLLNNVQLTKSNRAFVGFNADRTGATTVVKLDANGADLYDAVVYVQFKKSEYGEISYIDSTVVQVAGDDGLFTGELSKTTDAEILYAYGIKYVSSGISTKFANLIAPTSESVASLLTSSSENMASVVLTMTAGLTLGIGESIGDSDSSRFLVTSCRVGEVEIIDGVPSGSSIAAGETNIRITYRGDLLPESTCYLADTTDHRVPVRASNISSPVDLTATLVAGHTYSIAIREGGNTGPYKFVSSSFTVASE